jgi:16S rRNA processing protein RimM
VTAPEFAVVGRVRRAHGIRGELVVEPVTDAPDAIFASGRRVFVGRPDGELPDEPPSLVVSRARDFKEGLLVTFEGLADRTEAERYRERTFLVPVDELPPPDEDEVYYHDLIGMAVRLADGTPVGEVETLYELPQAVTIEIRRPQGDLVLVPWLPHMVSEVDTDARVVTITPPEGLLE